MKHLRKLSVVGALLFAPWLGFSSIANAGQPVCRCWSAGLMPLLGDVLDDLIGDAQEFAICDTFPDRLVATGEGPTFIAEMTGASGAEYVV